MENTQTAFYNHNGKILYGRNWPKVPEVQASIYKDEAMYQRFKKEMEYLLKYPVIVTNSNKLPSIKEGEFLNAADYIYIIDGNTVNIL